MSNPFIHFVRCLHHKFAGGLGRGAAKWKCLQATLAFVLTLFFVDLQARDVCVRIFRSASRKLRGKRRAMQNDAKIL